MLFIDCMDDKTTIKDLKEMVRFFCEERDWDQFHNPKDLVIGISTEAGELLDCFRFKSVEECERLISDINKKSKVTEEVADVFYFLLRLAQKYDIDLSVELEKKMKKNNEKYPVEESRGSNRKYSEV